MNVTLCINKHFFDLDKYEVCPHCGASPMIKVPNTPDGTSQNANEKKAPFWKHKKDEKSIKMMNMSGNNDKTVGIFDDKKPTEKEEQSVPTDTNTPIDANALNNMQNAFGKPMPSAGENPNQNKMNSVTPTPAPAPQNIPQRPIPQNVPPRPVSQNVPPRPVPQNIPQRPTPQNTSFKDELNNTVSSSGGKTVGYFAKPQTQSQTETSASSEPVVGWLVCIKGVHFGNSFAFFSGRNSIGRGETNRINISKDMSVSREKHAWITYEPKKREFFIQPGESSGLSYLNGDTVMETQKMKKGDIVEFGDGKYMLIPLCDNDFTWEDYI